MDILIMLDEAHESPNNLLAHVNSVPERDSERPAREVITMYGEPDPERLALALAAAVESHREANIGPGAMRHMGVWPERGALGDSAWRDATGALVAYDINIPVERLQATSRDLLRDCGAMIGRLLAGLLMPDWPEGARRSIRVSLDRAYVLPALASSPLDSILEAMREGDGDWFSGTSEAV